MSAPDLKERVVRYARELGFDLVRIASAEPLTRDGEAARERVHRGYMDGMAWYTEERVRRASDPQELLPGARSFIAVALSYLPPEDDGDETSGEPEGTVARYARWPDYHGVMKERLRALEQQLSKYVGRAVRTRVFVDDSALLERAVAERAGIGWFGKNTNILTPTHGSWVFLGYVLTDLALEPDEPLKKSCGECTLCIPACPTGAIVAPYVLDARRCISYLTIENRGPVPRDLRPLVGDMVFGCDICQEVCPVNIDVPAAVETELGRTGFSSLELIPLLSISQEEFSVRFRSSPIKRAKRVGLQRNACVALGNIGDRRAVPALGRALGESEEPLVRGHAAWALGRLGGSEATVLLEGALGREEDAEVREEIEAALGARERV
ncbi:MAG: tRNA epoxyqueuosine(34) reductase QueG [Chloroflexi bacterium]|nr:tRNA epoxyqueuosine(34) reductase QueG [Chloroflexota bacterium]